MELEALNLHSVCNCMSVLRGLVFFLSSLQLMLLYSSFLELHEGDVQMPVEKLWEGAEYSCRDSETHTDRSPWVRELSLWKPKGRGIEGEWIHIGWGYELHCPWLLCLRSLIFSGNCRVMHQGEWEVIPIVRHFLSWTSVNFARSSNTGLGHTALPNWLHNSVVFASYVLSTPHVYADTRFRDLALILSSLVSHQMRCLC